MIPVFKSGDKSLKFLIAIVLAVLLENTFLIIAKKKT